MKFTESLIQDAIQGKEEAIEYLYNKTYSNVHFIVFNFVKDADNALDLIMNTYTSGFHNLHMLTDASAFGDWIELIAENQVLAFLQKKNPSKYANITLDDIQNICELGLQNNARSKIKPNQRLLELIENECAFYDDADDYDMGNVQEIIDYERKYGKSSGTILKVVLGITSVILVAVIVGFLVFMLKNKGGNQFNLGLFREKKKVEQKADISDETAVIEYETNDHNGSANSGSSDSGANPTPTRIPLASSSNGSGSPNATAPTATPMPTSTPIPTATPIPLPTATPVPIEHPEAPSYTPDYSTPEVSFPESGSSNEYYPSNGLFEEHNVQEETFNY